MKCLSCGAELPLDFSENCPECHAEIDFNQTLDDDSGLIDATIVDEGEDAPNTDSHIFPTIMEDEGPSTIDEEDIELIDDNEEGENDQTILIDGEDAPDSDSHIFPTIMEDGDEDIEDDDEDEDDKGAMNVKGDTIPEVDNVEMIEENEDDSSVDIDDAIQEILEEENEKTMMIDGEDESDEDSNIFPTTIEDDADNQKTLIIEGDDDSMADAEVTEQTVYAEGDITATVMEEDEEQEVKERADSIFDMQTLPDSIENSRSDDGKDTFQEDVGATYIEEVDHDQIHRTITNLWSDNITADDSPTTSLKVDLEDDFKLGTVADSPTDRRGSDPHGTDRTIVEGDEQQSRSSLVVKPRIFRGKDLDPESNEQTDYEIIRVLGEGGMGTVYEANQTSIDRSVAIKTLKPSMAKSASNTEKFLSEAVVTGDLDHPNIVPIYDLGTNHLGEVFYAMLRVTGTPWDEAIAGKSLSENIEIFMKSADAVAFAHSRGVIHRDLKPENTMLGEYGEVLVMDWGLAMTTPLFRKQSLKVKSGSIGGTPAYMSPEMAKGEVHKIDDRSDVYLLGAILYEIVTGKPPHYGKDVMKCLFSAGKNEIRPTDKSGELIDIALKAMATDPECRFATVLDMQHSIREYLSHTESIALSNRAEEDLVQAEKSADYEDFSRARFGFQEAQNLWAGNHVAKVGIQRASLLYANCALSKSDFDLGLSLLDQKDPKQATLYTKLQDGQKERDKRASRLKTMQRVGVGLAALVLVTVSGAFFFVNAEKVKAVAATKKAVAQEKIAVKEKKKADVAKLEAIKSAEIAEKEKENAVAQEKLAVKAKIKADEETQKAIKEKKKADEAKLLAEMEEKKAIEEKKKADAATMKAIAQEKLAVAAKQTAEMEKKKAVEEKKKADAATMKAIAQEKLAVAAKQTAEMEKKKAVEEKKKADEAKLLAEMEKKKADKATMVALSQKKKADAATIVANLEKEKAKAQEKIAIAETAKAIAEKKKADAAKKAEEYEAYIAQIGLAAAKIQENSFESALAILDNCSDELKNWEWGRLMHLCSQHKQKITSTAPVNSVAISPDGTLFANGGWDRLATVYKINKSTNKNNIDANVVKQFKHGGLYVNTVAFSPDGKFLATGSNEKNAYVQIWDIESGKKVQSFQGHTDAVLSVQFSQDGTRLLTASYDHSARLWDIKTGQQIQKLVGHTWWVWSAQFQPTTKGKQETKIVTCSQDGTAIVWNDETGKWTDMKNIKTSSPFREHQGPVYTASFSPDGMLIATAGADRRLLLWNPDEIPKVDYQKIVAGEKREETPYRLYEGHIQAIRSVSFSNDGNLMLTGSHDNTIKVWSVEKKKAITTFRGHAGRVHSCRFSPDGRLIVSGSHDYTTRLWSIDNYEEIRVLQGRALQGHFDAVLAASFSPDGKKILTASRDRTAKSWSFTDGSEEITFSEGHAYLASSARFSPDGKEVFTAAVDDTVRMWNVATGTQIALLKKTGRNAAIALSANGNWLVTGGDNKTAKVWAVAEIRKAAEQRQTPTPLIVLKDHHFDISAIAFSPDNQTIYTGDVHGHARLWDRSTGKLLHTLKGHSRKIVTAIFIQHGKKILTASEDNSTGLWNVATGKEERGHVLKHPDSLITMTVSLDEKTVYTSCLDGKLRKWSLADAKLIEIMGDGKIEYNALDISGDGKMLLAADSESKTVRIFDVKTNKEITYQTAAGSGNHFLDFNVQSGQLWSARFSPDADHLLTIGGNEAKLWSIKSAKEEISFSPHGVVAAANFSPDGKLIVTASWDNSAKVWDAKTGQAILKLQGAHTSYVNDASFTPNGHVLTTSDDGTAKLWDIKTGKVIRTFSGHSAGVWKVASTTNGQQLITASADKTARIWDVTTGKTLVTLKGHQWGVLCADIVHLKAKEKANDIKLAVTGSEDNTAIIWDSEKGNQLYTLTGHTARVTSVAFSPDGSRVLTASADNTAKLWDAKTGKEILTLTGHQREITSIRFSPHGKTVLTASRDGKAIVWLAKEWGTKTEVSKTETAAK